MNIPEHSRCPSCSGNMVFSIRDQALVCESCGSVFSMEDYDNIVLEKARRDINFTEAADRIMREREQRESLNRSYSCRSCGGLIRPGVFGVSDACPFCGNSIVFSDKIRDQSEPDFIVPFKKDREFFLGSFRKMVKESLFVPEDFVRHGKPENIHACYIPFWIYDVRVSCDLSYAAEKLSRTKAGYHHKVYECIGSASLEFAGVPQDGSRAMPDEISQSLEPYNSAEGVPFHFGYLSGLDARIFDMDAKNSFEIVRKRLQSSVHRFIVGPEYENFRVLHEDLRTGAREVSYALYPIWTLRVSWKGTSHVFAMNGATGLINGTLPLDQRRIVHAAVISGLVFAVPYAVVNTFFLLTGEDESAILTNGSKAMEIFFATFPAVCISGALLAGRFCRWASNEKSFQMLKKVGWGCAGMVAFMGMVCIIRHNLLVLFGAWAAFLTGPLLGGFLMYGSMLYYVRQERRKRSIALRENADDYLLKDKNRLLARAEKYARTYMTPGKKMIWPPPRHRFSEMFRGRGKDDDEFFF